MDKAKIYHNLISKWLTLKEREFWTTLLERLLLGFSDQQLITGTAVLLMGFIRLPISNGQISVYHFSIVANLAWFSAVTHAITVLVLQDYFKLPKHYILRNVRILGMIIMGILLVVSLTFCLHTGFQTINCPAQCMILSPDAGKMPSYIALDSQINNTWITISIVFLLLTYLVTIPTLFPPMRRFLQRLRLRFVYIQIAGYTAAVYLTLLFIAGVMTIVRQRRNSRMVMEDDQVQLEDIWGFGQLLSVLMLLLPIFIAIEVYYGMLICFQITISCANKYRGTRQKWISWDICYKI